MIFWVDVCATQYEFSVVNGQLDFWISQGSVATVLRWGGQSYSDLRYFSSWCCVPKIIKIGQCFTTRPGQIGMAATCGNGYVFDKLLKKKNVSRRVIQKITLAQFFETRCTSLLFSQRSLSFFIVLCLTQLLAATQYKDVSDIHSIQKVSK